MGQTAAMMTGALSTVERAITMWTHARTYRVGDAFAIVISNNAEPAHALLLTGDPADLRRVFNDAISALDRDERWARGVGPARG